MLSAVMLSVMAPFGDQSLSDAGSSNITRLSPLLPLACQEFLVSIGKGNGEERRERKKERKKERKVRDLWYKDNEIYSKNLNSINLLSGNKLGCLSQANNCLIFEGESKVIVRCSTRVGSSTLTSQAWLGLKCLLAKNTQAYL